MADEVKILIKGDNADLQRALEGSRSSIKSFGIGIGKVMLAAAAAATAVAVAVIALGKTAFSFGKRMLDLFIEQEKVEARIGAVLKATGEAAGFNKQQMLDMASAMQRVTVHGDEVVLSTIAIIATFKGIKGEAFKDTLMMAADLADVLQTDLKSAALQLGKALNDPLQGMGALREAGVSFNEEQIEMVRVLQESGDLIGAQKVLFRELATEVGGAAAAAADTFGGRMIQMKNRLGDVGEEIGKALIPVLELIAPILEKTITVIENLTPIFAMFLNMIAISARALVPTFRTAFEALVRIAVGAFTVIQLAWEATQKGFKASIFVEGFSTAFSNALEKNIQALEDATERILKRRPAGPGLDEITAAAPVDPAKSEIVRLTGLVADAVAAKVDKMREILREAIAARREEIKLEAKDAAGGGGISVGGRGGDRGGVIEDLIALNRRITQAAAGTPEDKVVEAVKEGAKDQVKIGEKVETVLEKQFKLQKELNALLEDAGGLTS